MTSSLITTDSEREWIGALSRRAKVLLIDDEPAVVSSICALSQMYHMDLRARLNGVEGLMAIERERFDGVLLDLRLPDARGEDVFRRIRQMDREIPVGIISGFITEQSSEEMLRYGRFTALPKPFDDNLADLRAWFKALGIHAK